MALRAYVCGPTTVFLNLVLHLVLKILQGSYSVGVFRNNRFDGNDKPLKRSFVNDLNSARKHSPAVRREYVGEPKDGSERIYKQI